MSKTEKGDLFRFFRSTSMALSKTENYPTPKIKGNVTFKNQVKQNVLSLVGSNEKRFESFNASPIVSTKYKGGQLVEMKKQSGRKEVLGEHVISTIQSNVKPKITQDSTSRSIISFNKMLKRSEPFSARRLSTQSISEETFSNYHAARKSVPEFDKLLRNNKQLPRHYQVSSLLIHRI